MIRAAFGSLAFTVASGADAMTCMGSITSMAAACPTAQLQSLQTNPDAAVMQEVKAKVCEAGACKTAVDKAKADCEGQFAGQNLGEMDEVCDPCMEDLLNSAADMLACGITVPEGEDNSEFTAARMDKMCVASCKTKAARISECMTKIDQLDAEGKKGLDTMQAMCQPCVKEFMSVSKAQCGGQKLPTKENVQKAECKESYCAVKNTCPDPSTASVSPLAAVEIDLAQFKEGMQTIIDNAGCAAAAESEPDASSACATGASMAAMIAASAAIV